jgi:beta-glucanase (GH16 family)
MAGREKQSGVSITVVALGAAALVLVAVVAFWFGQRSMRAPAPTPSAPVEAELSLPADLRFIDRFETIDQDRWTMLDLASWASFLDNDYRPSQATTSAEGLTLTLAPNTDPSARAPLVSGLLVSREAYLHGYFETRLRMPRGQGLIAAFYTYVDPEGPAPQQELDLELLGQNTRSLDVAMHVGGRADGGRVALPFDAADDFNSYAIEWTPTYVRWYVNGRVVREETGERVARLRDPQHITISLWATRELAGWAGRVNLNNAPWLMQVSCVASAETYPGHAICPAED